MIQYHTCIFFKLQTEMKSFYSSYKASWSNYTVNRWALLPLKINDDFKRYQEITA